MNRPIRTIDRAELSQKLARHEPIKLVMALNGWAFDAGFTNVRRYDGGIADWETAGLPLEGEWIKEPGRPRHGTCLHPGHAPVPRAASRTAARGLSPRARLSTDRPSAASWPAHRARERGDATPGRG
jgi:hypothetical protein